MSTCSRYHFISVFTEYFYLLPRPSSRLNARYRVQLLTTFHIDISMTLLSFSYFLSTTSSQEVKALPRGSHEDDASPTSWEVVHSLPSGSKESYPTQHAEPLNLYPPQHTENLEEDETVMVDSIRSVMESVVTKEEMEGPDALQGGSKTDTEMLENCRLQLSQLRDEIAAKDGLLEDIRRREGGYLRRIDARDTKVADLVKYRDFAMQRIEGLESQLRIQARELQASKESSDQVRQPHRRASDPDAQGLSGMTNSVPDSISEAEVVERMRALNSEIQHTAIFIANAFIRDKPLEDATSNSCMIDARGRITRILGNKMVQLLVTTRGEYDLMLLQIAIKAILVELSRRTIESWSLGNVSMDQTFRDIYTTMQDAGEKLVLNHKVSANLFLTTFQSLSQCLAGGERLLDAISSVRCNWMNRQKQAHPQGGIWFPNLPIYSPISC